MVKKTRGPEEDRGGYGVQAEVIMNQLPQLRDRGEMVVPKKSVFDALRSIFGNRHTSLLGTLVYTAIVFLLGLSGLLFSYYFVSSPAWEAEYGYSLTPAELEEHLQVSQKNAFDSQDNYRDSIRGDQFFDKKGLPMAGFSIELLRLVLVSIIFVWLVGFVFNNTYVQVENFPQPFTRAWLFTPGTAFLILMLVVVASGLTAYHFLWAPDHLRLESQYWNKFKLLEKLWAHTPSAVYGSDFWFINSASGNRIPMTILQTRIARFTVTTPTSSSADRMLGTFSIR